MSLPKFDIWPLNRLKAVNDHDESPFHVFLDNDAMIAELFELPAGGVDQQKPHRWDELYYIISGKAQFTVNGQVQEIKAGDTIFVAALVDHRFHDITEDLTTLVVFSKKEPKK